MTLATLFLDIDYTINVPAVPEDHEAVDVVVNGYGLHCNRKVLTWLRALVDADVQLVWSTSWNELASTEVGPALGLQAGLPWVEHLNPTGLRFGWSSKIDAVRTYIEQQQTSGLVVILDDLVGGKDAMWAEDTAGVLIPALHPNYGVTVDVITSVNAFFGLSARHGILGRTGSTAETGRCV